jgi:raffinose/stachyose/melibiose transport system substrate-binding protein
MLRRGLHPIVIKRNNMKEKNADLDNFVVSYVPGKGDRRASDIVGGLSMGYYITKKAWDNHAKREACVDFIQAMSTDEVVSSFGALSVTALKNGTTPPTGADPLVMSALGMTKNCTGIVAAAQDLLNTDARGSLFGNVKNIVSGNISSAKAIDECLKM